jgi:acetoin utilization deacetylase AcuC-like enzyme
MLAFAHGHEALHAPRFFLSRGVLRANYEIPARAAALREALTGLGIPQRTPPDAPPAAIAAVHEPGYLAFLAGAAQDWAALSDPGPEVVANIHPTPEMLAQGARVPAGLIGQAGWHMADTACPIGPGTHAAAVSAAACAPMPRGPAGIATSTTPPSLPRRCAARGPRASR